MLHLAAWNGWVDIIETLIKKHGFDPMSKDTEENVPLHYSAACSKFEAFKVLVTTYHCDPLCKNSNDVTPLYFAIIGGCIEIFEYYVTLGLQYNGIFLSVLAASGGKNSLHNEKPTVHGLTVDKNNKGYGKHGKYDS